MFKSQIPPSTFQNEVSLETPVQVNISDLIDSSRVSVFQLRILLLCGFCLVMDGFDVQAMGYVAPAIVQDWQIDKAQLGPVFGAGLLGILIGSLLFSMAADRIGRWRCWYRSFRVERPGGPASAPTLAPFRAEGARSVSGGSLPSRPARRLSTPMPWQRTTNTRTSGSAPCRREKRTVQKSLVMPIKPFRGVGH